MVVWIFLLVLYILNSLTLMKVFGKAGIDPKKALIPGIGAIEWCKLVGRKPSYAAWFLVPIANIFVYSAMVVDTVRSFGRHSFWESFKAVVAAPLSFFQIGNNDKEKYEGPVLEKEEAFRSDYMAALEKDDKIAIKRLENNNPFKKSQVREWTEAIVFAVFAAAFIRMFLIEAYVIPTSSMEGSLKVGDYLFVSKAHYGIRMPMTVVQWPLLHNRVPIVETESYLQNPSLDYYRLPAIESVDRNEPVVFNFPAGDSVIIEPGRTYDIYQIQRQNKLRGLKTNIPTSRLVTRPLDKKDHYIKRCIGIGGDSLQIIDRQVFINGVAVQNPSHMQFSYQINSTAGKIPAEKLDDIGVSVKDNGRVAQGFYNLDAEQVGKIKAMGQGVSVEHEVHTPYPGYFFPYDKAHDQWTVDNFGPIWIPKKGASTPLNSSNIAFYERVIRDYEHNKLEIKGRKIFINGAESSTYTFKQNYYWCMGDNRHNSEDSRVWGYVPEDHIVGKPLFIWFSTKNANIFDGINLKRIFKSANSM